MAEKKNDEYIQELFRFIKASPTAFHAVKNIKSSLEEAGFQELCERDAWEILPGGRYFAVRGDSSVIAFCVPEREADGFRIAASHSDSPAFKLKPNAEKAAAGAYTVLNTEPYGGGIYHTWMDRPLSVAGRVIVRGKNGPETRLIYIDRDLLVIPSLAIHMDRDVNKKLELNAQRDLLPLFGDAEAAGSLRRFIAEAAGCPAEDILGEDLYLCSREKPTSIGAKEEYICGPRLDDLECAFGTLQGFLQAARGAQERAETPESAGVKAVSGKEREAAAESWIPMYCVFDNEEVGSATRQGAASTFLSDVLERVCLCLGYDREKYHRMIAQSFLVSADNAHAVHPNAADKADPVNRPVMNGGIVLKHSANQRYTTDGLSAAFLRMICRENEIPVQEFTNRSDIPGGSTLGNIAITKVPVASADIGLAQLAMHSSCETAGAEDLEHLIRFSEAFYCR